MINHFSVKRLYTRVNNFPVKMGAAISLFCSRNPYPDLPWFQEPRILKYSGFEPNYDCQDVQIPGGIEDLLHFDSSGLLEENGLI